MFRIDVRIATCALLAGLIGAAARAQEPAAPAGQPPHDHSAHTPGMDMAGPGWHYMQDGAVNAVVNHQGGPRGGSEVVGTSWYMGMWRRQVDTRRLTLSAMLSADPLVSGKDGYRELFQVGEVLDGQPLVDRQHPHDMLMQLSAAWRTPVGERGFVTLAGGPAGAPALGPVAFMHRPSAAAILTAPLSHHVFDSTHITYGVATVNATYGRVTVEGSVFNGREPDEDRWDFDFGRLDSASSRLWLRLTPTWTVQASAGRLVEPEALEPGNATRRTVSAAWWKPSERGFGAATVAFGENVAHGTSRRAFLAELGAQRDRLMWSARLEAVQVETDRLLGLSEGGHADDHHDAGPAAAPRSDLVKSLTLGAQVDVFRRLRANGSIGANLTLHDAAAVFAETHGRRPAGFQLFFQVRPNPGAMGRMWNNVMGL